MRSSWHRVRPAIGVGPRLCALAVAVLLMACPSVSVPPKGIFSDSATKTGANNFVCWEIDHGPGKEIASAECVSNFVEFDTDPADITHLGGSKLRICMSFPAGAGTEATLKIKNITNKPITLVQVRKWQVVNIPANLVNGAVGDVRPRGVELETDVPMAPFVSFGYDVFLGQVLTVENGGTVPLRVKTLQVVVSSTEVPFEDLSYDHPAVEALPWVTAISSDTDLAPGQSTTVDIPNSPSPPFADNLYLRSRYSGTSGSDPIDEEVLLLPSESPTNHPIPIRVALTKPGKLVKFVAKGSFDLPEAIDDPTSGGGTLAFEGASGSAVYVLPEAGWRGLGPGADGSKGFKFRGDPCRVVIVKPKVVKGVCRPDTCSTLGPLPEPGPLSVVLSVGTNPTRYCGSCGGTPKGNESNVFKRKECAAPPSCPASPGGAFLAAREPF
jgi:hypothetical protein